MSAYVKKIAVIKQIKSGFSADGGALSGLVKAETYAGFLKVEVSLINFAPLTEGSYVLGITDGLNTVVFEGLSYEGEDEINLSSGFAFLVCFCHNGVAPVASAACGQMACALPDLKEEMARRENIRPQKGGAAYDDEAITEVNYYERAYESGAAVRETEKEEKERLAGGEDAQDSCAVQSDESGKGGGDKSGKREKRSRVTQTASVKNSGEEPTEGGLAGGDYYTRMEGDIEKIFSTYPKESALERAVEGSRFAKISYGENKYYVFGVLTVEGKPRYLCYGVPAKDAQKPPPSLRECATYIAVSETAGYWMTYQDAATGVSIQILNS